MIEEGAGKLGDQALAILLKRLRKVERNVGLASFNPLGIAGSAAYYVEAQDTVELVQAVKAASEAELPYLVLGSGSRVVVPSRGYPGLVIRNKAQAIAFSHEQSQVVVESGVLLPRLVMQAASKGFGGLIPFYGFPGTLGDALYRDAIVTGQPIQEIVRSVTILLPPSKVKLEHRVVRQRAGWLTGREEGSTKGRLQELRDQSGFLTHQPVILTAQLQLTSLRADELNRRLHQVVQQYESSHPQESAVFGPLFLDPPSVRVEDLLRGAGATKVRSGGGLMLHPQFPNYLIRQEKRWFRRLPFPTPEELIKTVSEIAELVQARYHVELEWGFEVLESNPEELVP